MTATVRLTLLACTLGSLIGCSGFREMLGTTNVDQPVLGPPPPRRSLVADYDDETGSLPQTADLASLLGSPAGESDEPKIQQTSYELKTFSFDPNAPLTDSQIVATVNGIPIFAADALERYAGTITANEARGMPESEIQKLKLMLIKRDLDKLIERELLAFAFKTSLTDDQIGQIRDQMEAAFEGRLDEMRKQLNVETLQEIEAALRQSGSSLEALRTSFEKQALAGQYMLQHTKLKEIGRPELFAYYQSHREDYFAAATVRWQQIQIRFSQHGGRDGATERLKKAVAELQSGTNFGEVAKAYSDNSHAAEGGLWDWMAAGTLTNKEVEQALFELPLGKISQVFVSDSDFQLVRVLDRKEAGYTKFEDVYEVIRKQLEQAQREEASERVLKELKARATIETIFDSRVTEGPSA